MRQRLIRLGAVPGQIVISPSGADEELFMALVQVKIQHIF